MRMRTVRRTVRMLARPICLPLSSPCRVVSLSRRHERCERLYTDLSEPARPFAKPGPANHVLESSINKPACILSPVVQQAKPRDAYIEVRHGWNDAG
jgi:hypothetical protein